ncbi:zinc-binding alcohol dehydrogenase family protein [Herbiconiux liukaitaii]|uniref:zinc-binding alcohol dehydrogenase family protein n=1 Tax=Herbiconiux liukaitaii TaxID=3342799 RepID=UPI0035B7EB20
MSVLPTNVAAKIQSKHGELVVESAPYTHPGPGQVVVRNHAVAINPLDWIIQVEGNLLYGWLKYPAVLGTDVAGEVVELGEGVTRFSVGDRVFALAVGTDKDTNTGSEGAFQQYTVVRERLASRVPDGMSFEEASVLPMAVSTAAAGLFQDDYLGLQRPSAEARPTGKTVLVWGGSTSVGSNAIQLAVAAGYEVITTASPKNFDYVTSLGASQVFDYNSPTVIPDIITALADRTVAGAVSFGTTGAPACVKIMAKARGKKFVAIATPPVDFASLADPARGRLERARVTIRLIAANIALQFSARPHGVGLKYIFGTDIKKNTVSTAIFRDFLPDALADGSYTATPKPTVVGHTVGDFQHAMDLQRAGVSATKLVVSLDQVS